MFFFFFGGVQPEVSKVIQREVALCPRCGSDASLVDYDNVFRAFFVPVWRWAGANPAIHCETCTFLQPWEEFRKLHSEVRSSSTRSESRAKQDQDFRPRPFAPRMQCWSCSAALQPEFLYCPKCGAQQ